MVAKTNPMLSYTVATLALIYVVTVVVFAFRKPHQD